VLAVIIIYGLRTWIDITGPAAEDSMRVELYSKQFDWTARYSGDDGEFGVTNFNTITPSNPLGIVTQEGVDEAIAKLEGKIASLDAVLSLERGHLLVEKAELEEQLHPADHGHHGHGDDHSGEHKMSDDHKHNLEVRLHEVEALLHSDNVTILSEGAVEAKEDKIFRVQRHKQRLLELQPFNFGENLSAWDAGRDDKIVKGEFHLPLGQEVEFIFRSRDVIHSAYMPHFRAQMNTVPGLPTRFKFTPTITSDSMRTILDNPEFDYILLCNKICGAAHFNMSMKIIVDTPEEFEAWIAEQKEYLTEEEN
jgi:cytochrome c oxidase subunit 2